MLTLNLSISNLKMIKEINIACNWKGFTAIEIIKINDFGNVIFKTDKNDYWRICPEEISCEKIANSESELEQLFTDPEFIEDWEMCSLVGLAKDKLGELETGQKFCLKFPAVIGGEYDETNIGKISFTELISCSGDIGFQLKDVKDGQKVKLVTKNTP